MHDTFFFTDVHGAGHLFDAVMKYCKSMDPECTIIYGGDACDRGPDGYRIMKQLLADPQVIYIKGNHEDLFVKAAKMIHQKFPNLVTATDEEIREKLLESHYYDERYYDVSLHLQNGGMPTLINWIRDGMPMDFVDAIDNLVLTCASETIDFCHAGGLYTTFKDINDLEYKEEPVPHYLSDMILWDRNGLGFGWTENRICVFGHTPVIYLPTKYYGKDKSIATEKPCKYNGQLDERWPGIKIDMDTLAIGSGRLFVLNCLTMKAQGFRDTNINDDDLKIHNIEQIEEIDLN